MVPHSVERGLGYVFQHRDLLTQALTHRSFGNPNNERLEFLGDSILNCVIASLLIERFASMPEGDLSRARANLVNQSTLADIADTLSIGAALRLGEGEMKNGGAHRPSILADALEALFGAIFLDAGFIAVSQVIEKLYRGRLTAAQNHVPVKDAKTALQEWLQGRKHALPEYTIDKIDGEAHKQTFYVSCSVQFQGIRCEGSGLSRRAAEQEAAAKALDQLRAHGR